MNPKLEKLKKAVADHKELIRKFKEKKSAGMQEQISKLEKDIVELSKSHEKIQKDRKTFTDDQPQPDGTVDIRKAYSVPVDRKFNPNVHEFQKRAEVLGVAQQVLANKNVFGVNYDIRKSKSPRIQHALREYGEIRKVLNDTTGYGAEFIPDDLSPQYTEYLRINTVLPSLFPMINMTSPVFKVPYLSGGCTCYLAGEASVDDPANFIASTPGTGASTLTAKKFAVRSAVTNEQDEDAIFAQIPMVRDQIVKSIADGIENAMLNGDTAGASGLDSDITSIKPTYAFKGLRAIAQDESFTTAYASAIANWGTCLSEMGKYAMPRDSVVCITSYKSWNIFMAAFSEVQTVDKYGPMAAILTGEIGKIMGIPILISGQSRDDLNASGKYDGTTVNNGDAVFVRKDAFIQGAYRGVTIKTAEDIKTDVIDVVGTARHALVYRFPSTLTDGHPVEQFYDID